MNETLSNNLFLEPDQCKVLEGVKVDEQDYHFLLERRWWLHQGYLRTSEGFLHQLILGVKGEVLVDHINENRKDNRRVNLRITTRRVNALNCSRGKNPNTGIRLTTSGKYQARLGQQNLGSYETLIDAQDVRKLFLEIALNGN